MTHLVGYVIDPDVVHLVDYILLLDSMGLRRQRTPMADIQTVLRVIIQLPCRGLGGALGGHPGRRAVRRDGDHPEHRTTGRRAMRRDRSSANSRGNNSASTAAAELQQSASRAPAERQQRGGTPPTTTPPHP